MKERICELCEGTGKLIAHEKNGPCQIVCYVCRGYGSRHVKEVLREDLRSKS